MKTIIVLTLALLANGSAEAQQTAALHPQPALSMPKARAMPTVKLVRPRVVVWNWIFPRPAVWVPGPATSATLTEIAEAAALPSVRYPKEGKGGPADHPPPPRIRRR